jgi:hypothetical protein
MRVMAWAGVAAVMASAACISTVGVDPSNQTSAVVMGQVLKADGLTPVVGPSVVIQLLQAPSGGVSKVIFETSVTADENGRFLFSFTMSSVAPQTGSANLTVTPPIASGLAGQDTTGIPVKIVRGQPPTDSTYVQFTLKAR